ncbi:glutathione S-transferase family protein [Marinomonas spartinae]|uniref:glutathione S-transferase family protein n=1 Tax=Marinomonas spartinae TaxID=1792290 RepID=UPI0018F1D3F3|nr:glutathione S-transferase family protein [Marinomonas spartinae]MBJ7556583.1 glutathione S-transferase family protein [Marinomonas spartinae]
MLQELILYSAQGSNSSERVEWVLDYKRIPYTRIEVTNEALHSTYREVNPFGYVPCLVVSGHTLVESMAIIEYIEETFPKDKLIGDSALERAAVRSVCEYVNASIHSPQNRTVLKAFRPELTEQSKRELRGHWIATCLNQLMGQLCADSPFAIGKHFSIADIFVASIYKKARQHGMAELPFYQQHLLWLRQNARIQAAEPCV